MYIIRAILDVSGSFMLSTVSSFYFGLLLYGLLTVLCEWKQIQIPNYKKILYVFTFPSVHVYLHPHLPGRSGPEGGVEAHLPHRKPEDSGQGRLRRRLKKQARTELPCGLQAVEKVQRTFPTACKNAITFAPLFGAKVLASLAGILARQGFRGI